MVQIILALVAIAALIMAFKIALVLIILAGLIFRTRETLGLLGALAAYSLFFKYPVISCVLIAVSAFIVIKAKKKKPAEEPAQLTDQTGG